MFTIFFQKEKCTKQCVNPFTVKHCAIYYYAGQHFPAHIYAIIILSCTAVPPPPPPPKPFPLLPSRTTFNLPAYHVLLSSLSVGLLSCLNHLNSVLDKAPKFGLVMIGRQAWVPDLMLWVYICYICIMFMFTLSYGD